MHTAGSVEFVTEPPPPADTEPWDAAIVAVLERAARLTPTEATALDAALRARPEVEPLAAQIVGAIEREVNFWATRADWEIPLEQMAEARRRVAIALGDTEAMRSGAFVRDDGSVAWGAATAAACAVLGSWASAAPELREPWDRVISG